MKNRERNNISQMKRIQKFEKDHSRFKEILEYLKYRHPRYKSIWDEYEKLISENVFPEMIFLDAGCGWMNDRIYKYSTDKSIGIDIDLKSLRDNINYDNLILSNLENIPFRNETVDIINTKSVMEHIEYPDVVFKEFFRLLKEKGILIMVVPNVYNPVNLFGKLTPLKLHKILMKIVSRRDEQDIYPTYFRYCSPYSIDKKLKECGFIKEEFILRGDFILFMHSKILINLWIIFDKLMPSIFKMFIMIKYSKKTNK